MRAPAKIEHQNQPTNNSCFTTCLAMLTGRDAMELIELGYHTRYHDGYSGAEVGIMEELGIVGVPMTGLARTTYWGCMYILCVPSVNVVDGLHAIIVDLTQEGTIKIFDPNKGLRAAKYYVPKNSIESPMLEPNAVELGNFHIDHRILECPVWPA